MPSAAAGKPVDTGAQVAGTAEAKRATGALGASPSAGVLCTMGPCRVVWPMGLAGLADAEEAVSAEGAVAAAGTCCLAGGIDSDGLGSDDMGVKAKAGFTPDPVAAPVLFLRGRGRGCFFPDLYAR